MFVALFSKSLSLLSLLLIFSSLTSLVTLLKTTCWLMLLLLHFTPSSCILFLRCVLFGELRILVKFIYFPLMPNPFYCLLTCSSFYTFTISSYFSFIVLIFSNYYLYVFQSNLHFSLYSFDVSQFRNSPIIFSLLTFNWIHMRETSLFHVQICIICG